MLRANPSFEFELFLLKLVGGDKEFFQFFASLVGKTTRIVQVPFQVRVHGDRKESIVSLFFTFVTLNGRSAPITLQRKMRPGEVAASCIIMTSRGSPSSASVEGMKPQS